MNENKAFGISKLKNIPKGEVQNLISRGEITLDDVEQIIKSK